MTEENTIEVQATEVPDTPEAEVAAQSFAFPFTLATGNGEYFCSGMTLRDYFAAKVLNGFITALARDIDVEIKRGVLAESAYKIADAMIEVRGQQK